MDFSSRGLAQGGEKGNITLFLMYRVLQTYLYRYFRKNVSFENQHFLKIQPPTESQACGGSVGS